MSNARYYPFGEYRTAPTSNITELGYTGHHHNDYIKLVYMNSRWYDPALGRFLSADTIVPDPTNPQAYNRYSYVVNNPLKYIDPTGHCMIGYTDETKMDCNFLFAPPSTNPTGETINVNGTLRLLHILEGTQYEDMDFYEASLWWNTMSRRLNPFIEPIHDRFVDFVEPDFHQEQLSALRGAYSPSQLESMGQEPRNNDLSQYDLGNSEDVDIGYMNVLFRLNASVQFANPILGELGLGTDTEHVSNYEPNYLSSLYTRNPNAVDKVIARELFAALEIGHSPHEYRQLTTLPSDLPSSNE